MSTFDFAAAIQARPGGATRAQLVAAYGDPTVHATRTGGGKFEPAAAFRSRLIKIPIADLPGFPAYADPTIKITGVTLHEVVAPVFLATWAELRKRNLHKRLRTYDGAVTFRHMLWDYTRPVSLHAYGSAVDFDARWNGYGIPAARMEMDRDVVQAFCECGWHWGGFWNPTDGMHFQWTDSLPGVPVPDYQDAMARKTVQIVKPELPAAPAPQPVLLIPDGKGSWQNVAGRKVEGPFSVINAENPQKVWAR